VLEPGVRLVRRHGAGAGWKGTERKRGGSGVGDTGSHPFHPSDTFDFRFNRSCEEKSFFAIGRGGTFTTYLSSMALSNCYPLIQHIRCALTRVPSTHDVCISDAVWVYVLLL
jgi:hypothetical protein